MKKLIYSLLLFVLMSCSTSIQKNNYISINNGNCLENLDFKNEYFHHIKVADSLVYKIQGKELKESLLFISKYSHVSWESVLNYAQTYPIGIYEKDRKDWLKWYEENKCNNIQLKK